MLKKNTVIPAALRVAAEKAGSLEKLRARLKMSGGLFYDLLKGEPPKKVATLQRLKRGGVELPDDVLTV